MPTYDYKCRDCPITETITTGIKEELKIPLCKTCRVELVRDYGTPTIRFRGNGFYSTDKA